jgi:tetratricopeptide (TPR) repeat protein
MARSYERWLAHLSAAGEPMADIAARAANDLEKIVTGSRGALPERWSQTERIAATGAAAIWLMYSDNQFSRAERLLSAALADSADAPEPWKATAQTLRVFAVAAHGDREQAAELLGELSGGEPLQVLRLIEGLSKIAEQAPPAVARELAELELRAGQLLDRRLKELPPAEQRDFQRAQVRALAAAGRQQQALEAARKLAEALPRDGQIQEQYAGLLLDSRERADWQRALAKWRDIGQKTRQGSDRWLRAMYSQSLALVRLGQKEQAARLIKLTAAISPDLGGAEMKRKFRELLR